MAIFGCASLMNTVMAVRACSMRLSGTPLEEHSVLQLSALLSLAKASCQSELKHDGSVDTKLLIISST